MGKIADSNMNTTDEKRDYWTTALTSGAVSGIILAAYMAILYASGDTALPILGLVQYLILSFGINHSQTAWKKRKEDASYGSLLLIGLVCGISASLFVDLYSMIYMKVLNPSFADETMEMMDTMQLSAYGYSREQLRSMIVPSMPISITIIYSIITLLLSAFSALLTNMKKRK